MFKTSIEAIVADIQKKISQLRVISSEHHNQHLIHTEEAVRHTEVAEDQAARRDLAARIASNFEALLK